MTQKEFEKLKAILQPLLDDIDKRAIRSGKMFTIEHKNAIQERI